MLAYKYDEITKEYKGTQEAQINPLEGGYLLPANSTFDIAPETQTEQVAVFEIGKWAVKTDKRGTWQVKLDDVTFSKVDYIGDSEDGYQFITDEVYNNYQKDNDRYKVINGVFTDIIDTEEYKKKKEEEEKTRISLLKCTKRVFILLLEELGFDYFEQIEPAINAERQAKLEWNLCVELQRSNTLIDQLASQFGITSEQLDMLFKVANNENTVEELRGL